MITKSTAKSNYHEKDWSLLIIGLFIVGLLMIQYLFHAEPESKSEFQQIIYCSAESVEEGFFVDDGIQFANGYTQSDELAKSGQYSCLLDKSNKGISYTLKNAIPGTTYKASVWRRGQEVDQCFLAVKALGRDFYLETNKQVRSDGNYWGQLEIVFTIPRHESPGDMEIYTYKTEGSQKAFFDDFYLQQHIPPASIALPAFKLDTLKIQVNSSDMLKLDQIRKRAYSEGLYIRREGDFVNARIWDEERYKKADIRFKGDWLDHLSWKGQSYRIELKKDVSWKGMQSLSVQRPEVRGYLREWFYHQFLQFEDVLTPRYDFVSFKLNAKNSRIYAFEEHFTKHLLERQKRREAPILKFNEDRFWEGMQRSMTLFNKLAGPENKNEAFWSAEIEAFKSVKTAKDSTLSEYFDQAKNLLYQYKYNLKPAGEIFDVERMAKYVAISDLCLAHHALTWHNQRFYYNPISNLLEPIGFDGYGEENPRSYAMRLYTDEVYGKKSPIHEPITPLFKDPDFLKAYFRILTRISDPEFIDPFMAQLEESLIAREKLFGDEKNLAIFDRNEIFEKAKKIQSEIWPFDNSLQVYSKPYKADSITLMLINHHSVPLELVIPGISGQHCIVFPQSNEDKPAYKEINVSVQVKELFYSLPGCGQLKSVGISPFTIPADVSSRQQLKSHKAQDGIQYLPDNTVLFHTENIAITQPLYINENQKLVIHAGTRILFKDQGCIVSQSPVFFNGTKEKRIVIESEDGLSGSITVLQSDALSEIHYTDFKNLNTLDYKGWILTGAVTFYESNVNMSNCTFVSNHCEDALNIIKSDFLIENCQFDDIFSDAFDADFCTGTVIGSRFQNTGNDALDFSGGNTSIHHCTMKNIGDKAISVGESATLRAKDIDIEFANFAVVSKDHSKLFIENVNIQECQTGFAAYQKKPEFGPADIICSGFTSKQVERLFMIEAGSTFTEKL